MAKYIINGGLELSGVITPKGNKNEALPAIAAAILTDEVVILHNVPRIIDVEVMVEIVKSLGASAEFIDHSTLKIQAKKLEHGNVPENLSKKIRASFLCVAPLINRVGYAHIYPPGGDVIGRRGLQCHYQGLEALGATISLKNDYRIENNKGLKGASIFLDEPSVTGSEQIILAAVLAEGVTALQNVAMEPHVVNLCLMLKSMGAKIEGIGTNSLVITGVKKLKGTNHTIGSDYIEIGSFITLALTTNSEIEIRDTSLKTMPMILKTFEKFNAKIEIREKSIFVPKNQNLEIKKDLSNSVPIISDGPWPQFPTDLMSNIIILATKCKGMVLIFEKMFDKRMVFVDNLIAAGANIIICDPHRIVVSGPCDYLPGTFVSPDIRAGISLLISCLSAKGKSTIKNIQQIERGYELMHERLKELGANIEKVN